MKSQKTAADIYKMQPALLSIIKLKNLKNSKKYLRHDFTYEFHTNKLIWNFVRSNRFDISCLY